jgi:hypothetical protein
VPLARRQPARSDRSRRRAHYNYKDAQNTNKSYTNAVTPIGADGTSVDL